MKELPPALRIFLTLTATHHDDFPVTECDTKLAIEIQARRWYAMRSANSFESGATPPDCRSDASRTGCARRHAEGSPRPDAQKNRSWPSAATRHRKSFFATPKRPIKYGSRKRQWQR